MGKAGVSVGAGGWVGIPIPLKEGKEANLHPILLPLISHVKTKINVLPCVLHQLDDLINDFIRSLLKGFRDFEGGGFNKKVWEC